MLLYKEHIYRGERERLLLLLIEEWFSYLVKCTLSLQGIKGSILSHHSFLMPIDQGARPERIRIEEHRPEYIRIEEIERAREGYEDYHWEWGEVPQGRG